MGIALALLTMNVCNVVAQAPLGFEVASIKLSRGGVPSDLSTSPGGRLTATNVSLKFLIKYAFGVKDSEMAGGPSWLDTEKYDIVAKADTPKQLSEKELEPYLRSLLGDRFKLKFHRETRELLVYSLLLGKSGPKLTEHVGEALSSTSTSYNAGMVSMNATRATMANFANSLGFQLAHTVTDNTGLKGEYDIKLDWAPQQTADASDPSIFTALQEQLGLKLLAHKGPVEVIVIDGAEKASEN